MTTEPITFRSRWGFHPCSYETFRKLKRLHKWYWQTVRDFHRWHRWWRKQPQNRTAVAPKFCLLFIEDREWHKPIRVHGTAGVKYYPKTLVDRGLVELYQGARKPAVEPVAPLDDQTRSSIEALYSQVVLYFDS